jgi:DNA-binding transcriptional LysR family regulator
VFHGDKAVTAITDLEIFARVARTGNMSAAGREMGLSPAVVSKRVSLLEERLGTRLFQRTTRQLTLTETGEGYFKRVVDILSLIAEAEDFVSRRNTKPRGVLKVTAPTAFSRLHIAPYLPKFLGKYPEIELDFHLTDNYVDIIREGFDLAVRIGELRDSSLVQRKLAGDTRVICAAPKYIEQFGSPTSLADLDFHNCLSAAGQEECFRASRNPPRASRRGASWAPSVAASPTPTCKVAPRSSKSNVDPAFKDELNLL